MARFSNQRLLQAFDVLHELYAFQDQDAFTQQLPASMRNLVQAEVCSINLKTAVPHCLPWRKRIPVRSG